LILRHTFTPLDNPRLAHLCGALDEHLRAIEAVLPVTIIAKAPSHRRPEA
jgi:phosphate starvation-inducible PhoH-like protein